MASPAQNLPSDPAVLHAIIAGLTAQLSVRDALIAQLRAQLDMLRRARFGASSEKIDRAIAQLELALEDLEEEAAQETPSSRSDDETPCEPEAAPQKSKPSRKPLPDHLPREEARYDDPPKACIDCGCAKLRRTGERIEEVLEYVPASMGPLRSTTTPLSAPSSLSSWGKRIGSSLDQTEAGNAPPISFLCAKPQRSTPSIQKPTSETS